MVNDQQGTSAQELTGARILSNRTRTRVMLAGGLLGALAGPTGIWLHGLVSLGPDVSGGAVESRMIGWFPMFGRILTTPYGYAVLAIPFLATLIVMPMFVRSLEAAVTLPAGKYYGRSALRGILLGLEATALVTFALFWIALLRGYGLPEAGAAPGDPSTLVIGGLFFGLVSSIVIPVLMLPYIVLLGIPFGLVFGKVIQTKSQKA